MANFTSMSIKDNYFDNLKALLIKEMDHERKEIAESIEKLSLKQRTEKGLSWKNCFVKEHGFTVGQYPYIVIQTDQFKDHQFSSGASVMVYCGEDEDPVKAGIQWIQKNKMRLLIFADDVPYYLKNHHFHIDLDFNQKQYEVALNAIDFAKKARNCFQEEVVDVLIGQHAVDLEDRTVEKYGRLNEQQNKALEHILCFDRAAIVHGPPGTGKTTVLVAAIEKMVEDGVKDILYITPGNSAANFVSQELNKRNVPVLRIGNPAKFDAELYALTPEHQVEENPDFGQVKRLRKQAEEFFSMAGKYKRNFGKAERDQRKALYREAKDLIKEARKHEEYLLDKVMDEHRVYCCTPIASHGELLSRRNFDVVIIDEAAQGIEPFLWVAINKGKKVVMAGDPFQLPPTIKSDTDSTRGLSVTLMEKCLKYKTIPSVMLEVQYRMHQDIMTFPSQYFYQNRLQAHSSVKKNTFEFPAGKDQALVFYDTAGCGFDESAEEGTSSRQNKGEADLVAGLVKIMPTGLSYAIISPYKGQVNLIGELLGEETQGHINTVDAFQGQERDLVIISMVRSNPNGEIGFLKDYRRMNVAMTRARKKLILIGDSSTFGNDAFYGQLLDYIEKSECWGSAWELME